MVKLGACHAARRYLLSGGWRRRVDSAMRTHFLKIARPYTSPTERVFVESSGPLAVAVWSYLELSRTYLGLS